MIRLKPTSRYAKAVVNGNLVYVAGTIAENWNGDISQQTKEILAQIDGLLREAGSSRSKLLSMTCWIKDFADYDAFNRVYDDWIDKENLPARATVRADLLDPRLKIEIAAVAAI